MMMTGSTGTARKASSTWRALANAGSKRHGREQTAEIAKVESNVPSRILNQQKAGYPLCNVCLLETVRRGVSV